MKEYKQGTFDRRVAYGQRERKLILVARGIMYSFKVACRSEKKAENLARALRLRWHRMESRQQFAYAVQIKVEGKKIYVTRKTRF